MAEGIIGSTESNAVKTESRKARKARKRRRAAELPAKEESVDDTTGFTNTETVRAGKRRKMEDAPTASGSGYESNVSDSHKMLSGINFLLPCYSGWRAILFRVKPLQTRLYF